MSRLSVLFVRTALLYLALGFTLGATILMGKGIPAWQPGVWRLLPAHYEFLLLGWTLQLACGVAFWILPRWGLRRGDERWIWATYILLNAGIWLVIAGSALARVDFLGAAGRLCEVAAVLAFATHAWPRVKPWVEPINN